MKKTVLLVTAQILSCLKLIAQVEKTTDLVGYGGGQYEVFKTGGQDEKACEKIFTENAVFDSCGGQRIEMNEGFFESYFESIESISWKVYGIVPLKIENTDPQSGVLVTSIEKHVGKDGTVWEKELVEQFYFNLEGKIQYVVQWSRDLEK